MALSPTQSETTMGIKLYEHASTAVALTHPLVVHPQIIRVSILCLINHFKKIVEWKADASVLSIIASLLRGSSSGTIKLNGLDNVKVFSLGAFFAKIPEPVSFSGYIILVKDIGIFFFLENSKRSLVFLIAWGMLPPPKIFGSLNPFTKSIMTSAGDFPKPSLFPKPCFMYISRS